MTDSELIRQNIEQTRAELGSDVDALADKVRPSSIAHRQVGKLRGAVDGVRDRVMGAASNAGDGASGAASSVGHAVADAPHYAARKAEGHPVAVGLIAFGVGLLASALLPATDRERGIAQDLKESAQPLTDSLRDTASEVAQNLKEPARDAANSLKDSAAEAVDNVKSEGSSAASDVKDSAASARG